MKRISLLLLVLGVSFVTVAQAQQLAPKPLVSKHLLHRMATQIAKTHNAIATQNFNTQANLNYNTNIWELGTYPGGTWFATWHINDFGVIVGLGDVPPDGYTHTLLVPLFGKHAGEWTDLGTLGGTEPTGWEEPLADISNSGLVVSHSTAPDGQAHGVAWTKETDMVDLGTLADTGDPRYASYNSSYAMGTNKPGTLIVGQGQTAEEYRGLPVVWTPSYLWIGGKFVTKWKIQQLDLTGSPDIVGGVAWEVNDYGQIIGSAWNSNLTLMAALWNPRADGTGWRLTLLPPSSPYQFTQAYDINNRGEIVGVANSADFSISLARLWKPLNSKRTKYSQPIELPVPVGFTYCETVGVNNVGDMVGDCWNDTEDLPTRWSTKDVTFSEIIDFPADWGFAWGVNNNRIASITYNGENCPGDTYGSCAGAVKLH